MRLVSISKLQNHRIKGHKNQFPKNKVETRTMLVVLTLEYFPCFLVVVVSKLHIRRNNGRNNTYLCMSPVIDSLEISKEHFLSVFIFFSYAFGVYIRFTASAVECLAGHYLGYAGKTNNVQIKQITNTVRVQRDKLRK